MRLLAVDPGIRGCGVAMFRKECGLGVLEKAAYLFNEYPKGNGPREAARLAELVSTWAGFSVEVLALEYPRVYPSRNQKGDQNDLLPLAGIVCAVAAFFPRAQVLRYFPRDWKGTADPDVMIERIISKVTPEERTRVVPCPEHLMHNVWDAVGIGLFAVDRLTTTTVRRG